MEPSAVLLYTNRLSNMTHVIDYPGDGVFNRTFCGVRLGEDDYAYEAQVEQCTCNACRLNMEQQKCQRS